MSNIKKAKILVIDDWFTRERGKIYNDVLQNDFEIHYVESGSSLYLDLEKTEVDLYLIDIILKDWIDPKTKLPVEILDVLKSVPSGKPILLVSNEYKKLLNEDKLTRLMNEIIDQNYAVTEFIVWADFETASNDFDERTPAIVNKIKLQERRYEKRKEKDPKAKVGIIAALELELAPFLNLCRFEGIREVKIGNMVFKKGIVTTKSNKKIDFVAVRQLEMGMVDTAYIASIMATHFKIEHLFMIGVCGGRESVEVKVGDLIIPKESVTYQGGKIEQNQFLPGFGYAHSNSGLYGNIDSAYAKDKLKDFMKNYLDALFAKEGKSLGVSEPNLKVDEMACGDYIIDKKDIIDKIAETTGRRKLCAVEMESYPILRLPVIFPSIKSSVLKVVMDLTKDKNDNYKDYAAFLSASFLYQILLDEKYVID